MFPDLQRARAKVPHESSSRLVCCMGSVLTKHLRATCGVAVKE